MYLQKHFIQSFRLYEFAQYRYRLYTTQLERYRKLVKEDALPHQKKNALCKIEDYRNEYVKASAALHAYNETVVALLKVGKQTHAHLHLTMPPIAERFKEQKQIA